MAIKQFAPSAVEKKPIKFKIGTTSFTFNPPKRSGLLLGALNADGISSTRSSLDWITKGLSREHYDAPSGSDHAAGTVEGCQGCDLIGILMDEDEPFDLADLGDVFSWLIEETTARPSGK